MSKKPSVLIFRFSSIGDVTQCASVAKRLADSGFEVHWVTRSDLAPLVSTFAGVQRVWPLERREGVRGVIRLFWELRRHPWTHLYDAHRSLRSGVLSLALWLWTGLSSHLLRRPAYRWKRFLLFRLRINTYPQPFSGQRDLLAPLAKWGISPEAPAVPLLTNFPSTTRETVLRELSKSGLRPGEFTVLCPSAAHALKRWPLAYWEELIRSLPEHRFVVLGGVHDRFLSDLVSVDPNRVFNFSGRLALLESAFVVTQAKQVIANDTGLLHVAEQSGVPAVALMGPAPFGFPSRPRTQILQRELACRPCSKHGQGPCRSPEFQKCLRDIQPAEVVRAVN